MAALDHACGRGDLIKAYATDGAVTSLPQTTSLDLLVDVLSGAAFRGSGVTLTGHLVVPRIIARDVPPGGVRVEGAARDVSKVCAGVL